MDNIKKYSLSIGISVVISIISLVLFYMFYPNMYDAFKDILPSASVLIPIVFTIILTLLVTLINLLMISDKKYIWITTAVILIISFIATLLVSTVINTNDNKYYPERLTTYLGENPQTNLNYLSNKTLPIFNSDIKSQLEKSMIDVSSFNEVEKFQVLFSTDVKLNSKYINSLYSNLKANDFVSTTVVQMQISTSKAPYDVIEIITYDDKVLYCEADLKRDYKFTAKDLCNSIVIK